MIQTDVYNAKFDEKLGPLANKIRENGFVLGGSSVISTIIGSDNGYEYSDFDIYVGYECEIVDGISINSDFDRWICSELGGVLVLNSRYQDKSWKYICSKFTINIVNTRKASREEIIEYIHETSDLDICMSTYDGFHARFFESLREMKARVTNSHLLETTFEFLGDESEREAVFQRFKEVFLIKRKTRQYKYASRGFIIDGSEISSFDEYKAKTFIQSQNLRETSIRDCLRFIAGNVSVGNTKTLADILGRAYLFQYKYETPIISIHHSLDFENYPWASKW